MKDFTNCTIDRYPLLSDEDVILLAQGGDTLAFSSLYFRYIRCVYQKCAHMLNDRHSAKDMAQEVFLKVSRSLTSYRDEGKFRTWLLSITFRQCANQLRNTKSKKNVAVTYTDHNTTERGLTDGLFCEEENPGSARVRHILKNIPANDRRIIVLRYWRNLSVREISQQLTIKESTVKMRLLRSRNRIKTALQDY